ncbi:protein ltv1 like protein [Quercus suber]|uniref:Protein ltv1 like protein n=1 Tax=Quercus suber TaxID=58331 RepID=A0AAW0MAL9_QUESU
MGRKKKFIDKKKSATFQLIARDSSDPIYDDSPGNDRVFVRIDNNPVSVFAGSGEYEDEGEGDSDSIFADAPEDNNDNEADDRVFGTPAAGPSRKPLPESVRKEILELGFPDDGYNYLKHLREIKNTGGGSAYYQNPKAKLEELPRDVKAYDASRVRISEGDAESNGKSIFSVASKTVGVRLQKAVDPEVAALLDDSDLSQFASDDEDLEEDFVVQANLAEEEEEEEEVDNRLNIVEEIEEKPENEVDKAGASGQQEVVDSLVFQNGVGNQMVKEGDEIVGDKPRAPRLLDEQFDLMIAYLGLVILDRAPADLLRDTKGPKSKELLETAADVIHRIVEYAEKYENESENEDKDMILEQESSDESEMWDCETIVSTYTNCDNHPVKIGAPITRKKRDQKTAADVIHRIVEYAEKYENESENEDKDMILEQESSDESEMWDCETIVSTYTNCDNHPVKIGAPITRKKKLAETVSNARGATSHVISLQGKQKLPVDFLPPSRKPAAEKVKDVGSNKVEPQKRKPNGQESKEEKKERKAAVKEERREARRVKKEMKELYRSEAQRAQKVAAVACPSSIHLM